MLPTFKKIFFTGLICFSLTLNSFAQYDPETALAKKAQNPIENMVSVPFDNDFNFGYGPNQQTQYELNLKPVVPFNISKNWNIITRTIIPVIHQPDMVLPSDGYINGIGDFNPSLFLSPATPGKLIWGIGPSIILPTASNTQLGQGKYSVGPSIVMLCMPGHWVIGFLTSNVWSVAGSANRQHVNQFSFQYFINYNFEHGWYLTSQPTMTANWVAENDNRWTIPIGLGGGRVFHIKTQAINTSLQFYDYIITPKTGSTNWQFELNVSFLFPKDVG